MVNIRNAEARDVVDVFRIRAAARSQVYRSFFSQENWHRFEEQNATTPDNFATWHERAQKYLAGGRYIFRVAVDDERVVGWLLADIRDDSVHIMRLFVAPERQGVGIGGKLLADLCLAKPNTPFTLTVMKPNIRAIAFYEKHGYRVIGEARYRYLDVPYVRMLCAA